MNPAYPNPYQQPQQPLQPKREPAEKRFKGLIITGQVFAILTFIGIILVFVWTIRQKSMRMAEDIERMTEAITQEMDVVTAPDDFSGDYDIDAQETANEMQYELIKLNTPDTTTNRYDIISALEFLRMTSDNMCEEIRTLKKGFEDTLYYATDNWETSESYFVNAGRAKQLKNQLYVYRENVISRLESIGYGNDYSLREAMPLDNTGSSYVTAWDDDQFSYSPSSVKTYLHDLEMQVRNFESTAQNQFPQTVSSY